MASILDPEGMDSREEFEVDVVPEEIERKIASDSWDLQKLYFDQNEPIWSAAVDHWKLYHGDTADPRTADEKKWRAHLFPPKPQINTEAKVAVLYDLITSLDSLIQAEGIGEEDEGQKAIERLFAYQHKGMRFLGKLPPTLRAVGVQGGEFAKLTWGEDKHSYDYMATQRDTDYFEMQLIEAARAGAPDPPNPVDDPVAFGLWKNLVNKQGKVKISDPPMSGKRLINIYRGPKLQRLSLFDVWLDPVVQEIEEQEAVFHRVVVSKRWVLDNCDNGDESWKPFNADAVRRALDDKAVSFKEYGARFTTHRDQIYQIMGINPINLKDPLFDEAVEIFECFYAGQPLGEYPHVILLNGVIINKNPRQMPFMHGQIPIFNVRNLVLPGQAHGISDYKPLKGTFLENAKIRNLRLDGATLALIPIIAKLTSLAMPELMKELRPGMILPVQRMDGFGQLFKMTMPEAAFREPADLNNDIDESMATYGNVRGQEAQINRVSATAESGRTQQALSRLKLNASQFEEDLSRYPYQSLALWYQYGDEELRTAVGGPGSPYEGLSKDKILEAMQQDYRFAGATRAINREQQAQKLMEFGKIYANSLTPVEFRMLMKIVIDSMEVRKGNRIVSSEGDVDAKDAYEIKKNMAKMQAAVAEQQMQVQQMAGTAPGSVDQNTMAAIEAGGGEAAAAPSPEAVALPGAPLEGGQ